MNKMTFEMVLLLLSVWTFVVGIVWVNPPDTLGIVLVKFPVIIFGLLCMVYFAKRVGIL